MILARIAFFLLCILGTASSALASDSGCVWAQNESLNIVAVDRTIPACAKSMSGFPDRVCVGMADCTLPHAGNLVLVCEPSADGACPSARECYEKGTLPGNPNGVEKKNFFLYEKTAMKFSRRTRADGSVTEVIGRDELVSKKDPKQGVATILFVTYANAKDEFPSSMGNGLCIKSASGTLQSCLDDPCLTYSTENAAIRDY